MDDAEEGARGTGLTRDCCHGEDWRSQCAEVDYGGKDSAQGAAGQGRGRTRPRRDICAGWDPVCSDDPLARETWGKWSPGAGGQDGGVEIRAHKS